MAKFEIIPGLTFVDRSGWNASKSHPRLGRKVSRNKRTHVIVHHTVLNDADDKSPNIWETISEVYQNMRKLQTIRKETLGADVPYNFVAYFMAKKNGVVICEGRGEDRTGAHTKGHNTEGIGIAFAGDFEDKTVAGIEFLQRMHLISVFLGWLKYSASHPNYGTYSRMKNLGSLRPDNRVVFCHQDFKATACPGKKLKPHLTQLTFINPDEL